jgi:hypothetical protein
MISKMFSANLTPIWLQNSNHNDNNTLNFEIKKIDIKVHESESQNDFEPVDIISIPDRWFPQIEMTRSPNIHLEIKSAGADNVMH